MIKYIWMVFLSCLFVLSAWILSPFLSAYSVVKGINTLPDFWQNFSTLDDNLDGGQHQHPELYTSGVTGWKLWWQRTCWICRNPSGGWGSKILGFLHEGMTSSDEVFEGNPNWDSGYSFFKNKMVAADGKKYWSYRRNIPVGSSYYIKTWFGWNYMAYDGIRHGIKFLPSSLKRNIK